MINTLNYYLQNIFRDTFIFNLQTKCLLLYKKKNNNKNKNTQIFLYVIYKKGSYKMYLFF